jgi:U3 small nucleolar RNA-associated protein 3
LQILSTHYPEFEFLADDFTTLYPTSQALQQELDAESTHTNGTSGAVSVTMVKCRALAAYMSSLAMYFAILSSPAKLSDSAKPMDPGELHDHPVSLPLVLLQLFANLIRSWTAS